MQVTTRCLVRAQCAEMLYIGKYVHRGRYSAPHSVHHGACTMHHCCMVGMMCGLACHGTLRAGVTCCAATYTTLVECSCVVQARRILWCAQGPPMYPLAHLWINSCTMVCSGKTVSTVSTTLHGLFMDIFYLEWSIMSR